MSKLPFELLLALRYLRPKRTFVSVITLISVVGVTLGVAVLIIVISVMSGFDHELREKILGFNSHIQVFQPRRPRRCRIMPRWRASWRPTRMSVACHRLSWARCWWKRSAETNQQALVDAPILRGVDPQTEGSVSVLPQSIVEGKFDLSGQGVVVGSGVCAQHGPAGWRPVVRFIRPHDIEQMARKPRQGKRGGHSAGGLRSARHFRRGLLRIQRACSSSRRWRTRRICMIWAIPCTG